MDGLLVVISGPSGVGKGTIYNAVLKKKPNFVTSISATTRSPRGNEKDGVEYFFLSNEQFDEFIDSDGFLEYADVFGKKYGTPKKRVLDAMCMGETVMLEIDVRGAMQIKEKCPECVTIFILPPSLTVLENRLRGRATDSEESILRRLKEAKREIESSSIFDYVIVNDHLNVAVNDVIAIIRSENRKVERNKENIEKLLRSEYKC